MTAFRVASVGLGLCISFLVLAQQWTPTYLDIQVDTQFEADQMQATLRSESFPVQQRVGGEDARIHLRLGPFNSPTELESAKARLVAEGVKNVTSSGKAWSGVPSEVASGSAATLNAQQELESRALAKLGLSRENKAPQTQFELEAEALTAMQANTKREASEAEKRRVASKIAEEKAEAERLEREIERQQTQVSVPAQMSTAASILNSLSGVVSQGLNQMAEQSAQRQAQIEQAQQIRMAQAQQRIDGLGAEQQSRRAANGHVQSPATTARIGNVTSVQATSSPPENHATLLEPVLVPSDAITESPKKQVKESVPGHHWCVHQTYRNVSVGAGIPPDDYLTFVNECVQKVRVVYFVGKGSPSLQDLEINETFSKTGITRKFGEPRGIRHYVCPMDHPHPRDASGQSLTGPVASYSCYKSD